MSTPQTEHQTTITPETSKTAISLGRIVLFGVGLALISLIALAWYNGAWQLWATSGVTFVTALVAIASINLISKGRPRLAAWMLIGASAVTFLLGNILVAGVSWALAALLPTASIMISYILLPPQNRRWINVSAVFVSILLLVTDFVNLPFRLILPDNLQGAVQIIFGITLVVLLAYMAQIIRTVRARLVIAFLVVALTPLGILAVLNTRSLESRLKENANEQLRVIASQSAANLDGFIQTNLDILRTEAQLSDLADLLVASASERPAKLPKVESILTAFSRRDQVNILSYSLFNLDRIDIADSFSANEGGSISDQEYFKQTLRTGLPTISPIFYKDNSFYFSAPVRDSAHETVGILRIQYNASVLQQIIAKSTNLSGPGSFAMLLDENHIFLANGAEPEVVFKSLIPLDSVTLAALQKSGQLPDGTADQFSVGLPALENGLQSGSPFLSVQESSINQENQKGNPTTDALAVVGMTTRPWVIVYSMKQSILLEPVQKQTLNTALLAFLISLAVAVSALVLSQTLVSPLVKLTGVAREVTQGNVQAYATATSNDEFGILANAFNTMTSRLRDLIYGLESRVAERTNALEIANVHNQKRAVQFETIAQVAHSTSSILDIDELLPLITQLISKQFGFYHTGIFLLDDVHEYAVLRAANTEGGKRMLARGHRLRVGQTGIVGYVTGTGHPRVALDTGEDAVFFDNPDLPDTRSEMALPLNVAGQLIGALDVQSTEANAFGQEDIEVLSTLADQVSIAIQNASSFRETQKLLSEAQSTVNETFSEAWKVLGPTAAKIGYQKSGSAIKPLEKPLEGEDIRQAMESGETVAQSNNLTVPIRLRGQVIGVINLQVPQSHTWNVDDVDIAEAVAERLSLAIETSTLLKATQHRADIERITAEISGKLSESNRMEIIIQTAAEELSRALGGSDVLVQIEPTSLEIQTRDAPKDIK